MDRVAASGAYATLQTQIEAMNPNDIPTSPLDRILLAVYGDDARDALGLTPDTDHAPIEGSRSAREDSPMTRADSIAVATNATRSR